MTIYPKKAYRFPRYVGKSRIDFFDVQRGEIVPVPDWVTDTPLFKAAVAAGNISVVGKAGDAKLNAVDAVMAEAKRLGIKNPGNMTLDQLQQAIADAQENKANDDEPKADDKAKKTAKELLVEEAAALGIENAGKLTVAELNKEIADAKEKISGVTPADGEKPQS